MKFARVVFLIAGAWGVVSLTPMYFLLDAIGHQHAVPITYPQFYYGFLAVAMAWQLAFVVIGLEPQRFRLMMIPGMLEKFGFILTMGVLYMNGRLALTEFAIVAPDVVLGVLFVMAFAKTGVTARR